MQNDFSFLKSHEILLDILVKLMKSNIIMTVILAKIYVWFQWPSFTKQTYNKKSAMRPQAFFIIIISVQLYHPDVFDFMSIVKYN